MNTKAIGDITEAQVMAALLRSGKNVLIPFGDNQRYDLVVEEGGKFSRVQCKTGKLTNGSIRVKTCSVVFNKRSAFGSETSRRNYRGEADLFGIYCPDTNQVYLVPVEKAGRSQINLRVEPTQQKKGIVWAKKFEIGEVA